MEKTNDSLMKDKSRSEHRIIILIILLYFIFSITSCGQSFEERQAKKAAKRKTLISMKEADTKILSDKLMKKYNATLFPLNKFGSSVFTYELQCFLSTVTERTILFRGYLEDIEKTERGIIVEFLCPLGKDFYLNNTAIRIRLVTNEDKIKQFLLKKRDEQIPNSIRYLNDPENLIVAKLIRIERLRRYEFYGSKDENEVEIEIPQRFIAIGELVEVICIPTD